MKKKKRGQRTMYRLAVSLDTFRRHFLIAVVVIIKDRTPVRVLDSGRTRDVELTYEVVYDNFVRRYR